MTVVRRPAFRIWIPGVPKSLQSKGSKEDYVQKIREAAKSVVPRPTKSPRVDIEIFFISKRTMRADVDNVIKPILDALIGVVYMDDKQVRSVRAVAIPTDDAVHLTGRMPIKTLERLFKSEKKEFFVDIYGGLATPGFGSDPDS
jgi:Holliday junction resolvase RusA-like endonuclease